MPTDLTLSNLPRDIIFDVLSRLPTKALLQFRCVSRSCPPLISHPDFVKLRFSGSGAGDDRHLLLYYESVDYTNHYYSLRSPSTFDETLSLQIPFKSVYGYLRIVGSSRGLICFFDTNYFTSAGRVIIWNPSIRKVKFVQNSHPGHQVLETYCHTVVGFGFVLRASDFKVVQILYDSQANPAVLVYSFRTDCWRKTGAAAPCFIPKCWSSNVFVNGFVNWLAYRSPSANGLFDTIMAFDLSDEVFRVIEFPSSLRLGYDQVCLSSTKPEELLSLCFHFTEADGDRWDIWVMERYGLFGSWKRIYSFVQPLLPLPPLSIGADGEVMFVMNHGKLVLYDVAKDQIKDLEIRGLPSSFRVVNYMSSLALLDG